MVQTRQSQRKAQRRAEFFAGKECVRCGSIDHLELDHIDPSTKEIRAGELWCMALDNPRRIKELAKSQVLCHDCHVLKTREGGEIRGGNQQNIMTDATMTEALVLCASGDFTYREIGDRFGVHLNTIRHAWHSRSWQHLAAPRYDETPS